MSDGLTLSSRAMSIRRQRTHWTGKSNRQRAKKYPEVDEMEVERMKGDLKISDQDFAATNNGWAKSIKIFEEPSIIRTRLGGTLFRPLSRCDSKQYIDVLEENLAQLRRRSRRIGSLYHVGGFPL